MGITARKGILKRIAVRVLAQARRLIADEHSKIWWNARGPSVPPNDEARGPQRVTPPTRCATGSRRGRK